MSGVLETHAQVDQTTAGQQLRQAREAAGLHVAALAGALKVPVEKLEALEADNYAAFSDTVFMRALASSICRTMDLDAQPILAKLPRSELKGLAAQRMQLNQPIKERAGKSGGGMVGGSGGVSRKAVGSVLGLLLAAAIVYFMPRDALDGLGGEGSSPVIVSQPLEVTPEPEPTVAQLPAAAAPAQGESSAAVAAAVAVAGSDQPAAQLPAAAATDVVADQAAAVSTLPAAVEPAAPAANTADAMLVFGATAPSWVQVKNARGAVVLQKNLHAGESAQVSVALPVSVVVGRVDVTTLQVRGHAFDLAAVARENVARFEVK